MMPADYIARDGSTVKFDLDSVIDVVAGYSKHRDTWTATLIWVPAKKAFVELRSSPQDYRGNSQSEAEEVESGYIKETFSLSDVELTNFKSSPSSWQFIDHRR
jgi:hypothetical protein